MAAALGVEGALLELDQGAAVLALNRGEAGRRPQRLVADELGRLHGAGEGDHPLVTILGAVCGGRAGPRTLALLLHQLLEAAVVDREAPLSDQLLGQVVGKAEGVVQLEGIGRVDPGSLLLLRLDDQLLEQLAAALQGAAEAPLLVANPARDRRPLGDQFRIGLAHNLDRPLGETSQPGRLEPKRAALLDRPPHDPPQDVAAVFVGGDDAVGDQEGSAARVVGDDPHRPRHRTTLVIGAARHLLGEVEQRPDQVGLVDRGDLLQDRRHPVEPHAGVDVAHRQLGQRAVRPEVIGHEDVVPELEVALAVVAGALVVGAELGSAVKVELRTWPARAGRASLPKVVLAAEADDPLVGHADAAPDRDRLLVGAEPELLVATEDGHPDPLGVHAEALGRELPAPGDRLLLEVVAEAPITQHLEEGEVTGGVADLLDVGRAKALLHVGEAACRRLFAAEEVGLEGLHPRRRQQHRGIVSRGHQRGRGHDLVPALREEGEVGLADVAGLHRWEPRVCRRRRPRGQEAAAIVPWPTIASPASSTAVCPGETPAKSSPRAISSLA